MAAERIGASLTRAAKRVLAAGDLKGHGGRGAEAVELKGSGPARYCMRCRRDTALSLVRADTNCVVLRQAG